MKSILFESAQNVKIEYEFASSMQRAVAALLDAVVVAVYLILFLIALAYSGFDKKFLLVELIFLKIPWIFYHPVLEYLAHGQTLGKYIMGIRVVTMEGERPGLREIFTRWIFKGYFMWIGFSFSFFFGAPELIFVGIIQLSIGFIGFFVCSVSERKQRIGDVMANTVVIRNKSNVRYTLNDVLSIKNQDNYTPQYPNAVVFTDDDMLLIKNTIQRVKSNPNPETKKFAIELADESARLIGLPETPAKRLEFLQTLLQDYVVLTR